MHTALELVAQALDLFIERLLRSNDVARGVHFSFAQKNRKMLVCVRHGESTENEILHTTANPNGIVLHGADAALTALGQQQAQVTAMALSAELVSPVVVWTSELQRTIDTAEPLVHQLRAQGKEVTVQHLGELNEKKERVRGKRIAEPLVDFVERVRPVARRVLADWPEQLVIVGHSVFISVLTSLLLRGPDASWDDLDYRNPNCAVTRFAKRGAIALVTQADISHLPVELQTGVD